MALPSPGDDGDRRDRDQGDGDGKTHPTEQPAHADRRDGPNDQREADAAEDGQCHRTDSDKGSFTLFHFCLLHYSAQQESFAGSLYREIATIFSASAIVG